jgi:general secretion pathway protein I
MNSRPRQTRGFTLLEMLVALTVLAIALMAALRASSAGVQNTAEIRNRLLAGWVAQNRLAEHIARRDWLAIGVVRGDESQAGMRFGWEEKIVGTPNFQFRRIEIRVFAEQQPDQALVTLSGFMVKPGG